MNRHLISSVLLFIASTQLFAVEEHIIKSEALGYSLKYWIHVPDETTGPLPVLYVTDGNGYKRNGLVEVSKSLVKEGKIQPHIIVMVSAVDPNDRTRNRRNSQFLCNPKYVRFYKEELIPEIENTYQTIASPQGRGILGLSFGGLNAMYFAIQANDTFGHIGIQSPAPHPCPSIYADFQSNPRLPINIFLSTGTVNDKATATRRLKGILEQKGYDFTYLEVAEGHNWRNWGPMLDDILVCFYGNAG
ncbi:MAG: alpha/beta hydrolase-fold protein [Cyclobacteriaceae bacterium]